VAWGRRAGAIRALLPTTLSLARVRLGEAVRPPGGYQEGQRGRRADERTRQRTERPVAVRGIAHRAQGTGGPAPRPALPLRSGGFGDPSEPSLDGRRRPRSRCDNPR